MNLNDRLLRLFSAMSAVDERIKAKDMAERRLERAGTLFGTSDRKKIQGTLQKQTALVEKNQRTLQQALSLIVGDYGLSKDTFVQACCDEADRFNADWGAEDGRKSKQTKSVSHFRSADVQSLTNGRPERSEHIRLSIPKWNG